MNNVLKRIGLAVTWPVWAPLVLVLTSMVLVAFLVATVTGMDIDASTSEDEEE